MKHFRIVKQPIIIAPKSNKDNGSESTEIVEAESLESILISKDWLQYDPNETWSITEKDFKDSIKEIKDNGGEFFTNKYEEYWGTDPRSEDGYALDAVQINITEMSEDDVKKHIDYVRKTEEAKEKAKAAKLEKNNNDWYQLLKSLNLEETDQGTLLDELQKYNFPTKIKIDNDGSN